MPGTRLFRACRSRTDHREPEDLCSGRLFDEVLEQRIDGWAFLAKKAQQRLLVLVQDSVLADARREPGRLLVCDALGCDGFRLGRATAVRYNRFVARPSAPGRFGAARQQAGQGAAEDAADAVGR